MNKQWLLCCLSILLVSGCASVQKAPTESSPADLAQSSTVSVAASGFSLASGARISWRREVIWAEDSGLPDTMIRIKAPEVKAELQRQLQAKGYRMVAAHENPQYHIVAATVVGDSNFGAAIAELARLYPNLNRSNTSLQKGTLMLGVSTADGDSLLWRAATQVLITQDTPPQEQYLRLQRVVTKLLASLPEED